MGLGYNLFKIAHSVLGLVVKAKLPPTLTSWLLKGVFFGAKDQLEQYLYLVNLIIIGFLLDKAGADFRAKPNRVAEWAGILVAIVCIVALLAFIAISSHHSWERAKARF